MLVVLRTIQSVNVVSHLKNRNVCILQLMIIIHYVTHIIY